MKQTILAIALLSCSTIFSQEHRQEIHCKHFFYGYPYGTPASNDLIIRDSYALSNNDSTKFADWVAYRLTGYEVDGELDVFREWRADPWLAENETLEPRPSSKDDYKGAYSALDVERGHQAPLASFKGSRNASETNYYSNITPQKGSMNGGPWRVLEAKVRQHVLSHGHTYVMTGPLYEEDMGKLPGADEPHVIPSSYWKVICHKDGTALRVAGFIMHQNATSSDSLGAMLKPIDEIEERSGLDLFWELDDAEEAALESVTNEEFAAELLK